MQILWLLLAGIVVVFLFYLGIYAFTRKNIYSSQDIPAYPTVLVLGAGLEKNGEPSDILKDRLITAYDLVEKSSPQNLILSGAKKGRKASEVKVMQEFLLKLEVKEEMIHCDENGFSTFHSLVNLKSANCPQPITIITQNFHLARALFIATLLGLDCSGYVANKLSFSRLKIIAWYLREVFALPYNILKFLNYALENYLGNS